MVKQKRNSLVDQYSTNKKASKVTGHPLGQPNTQRNQSHFDPKTFSMENRYYDRKVRESLEIDMAVVRYGQDKMLNRDNGNFDKTNAWKLLFKKVKTLHWNLTSFCIKWRFCIVLKYNVKYFDQFENGFNQCGRNITF